MKSPHRLTNGDERVFSAYGLLCILNEELWKGWVKVYCVAYIAVRDVPPSMLCRAIVPLLDKSESALTHDEQPASIVYRAVTFMHYTSDSKIIIPNPWLFVLHFDHHENLKGITPLRIVPRTSSF